jgi:polysaccharide chain length determinant protein (PEP-CTERM system associated)
MEEQTGIHHLPAVVRRYLFDLWTRRWIAVSVAWLVAIITMPAVMLVPNRYEASARVFVDTQTVLKPLMEGLTYQPDIDQQVKMLARIVVSRPNIEQLLARPDIGVSTLPESERERYLNRLMDQIKVQAAGTGNIYSITFQDRSQSFARKIVEATLDLFVKSSMVSKKRNSDDAGQFIEEQLKIYDAKLAEAENRLKEFKVRNFGVSGVSNQDFFARMSALSDEVSKLQVELSAVEQSREALRRELASENPELPPERALINFPPVVAELDSRIETQRKQLDDLLRRYTEEHPDVASTRRVIAQLEAQKRREAEEKAASESTGKQKVNAATSPIYQKIRVSLAEAEAQIASLRSQLAAKHSRLDQLRAVAGRVPQVEAELAQLNRDYEVVRKNYESLVARRESAAMGKKLDESSRLAEFRIVEPPRVAPSPVFPGRIHLALGAVALALLAGLASSIVLDLFRPTFKDAKALRDAIARPILGTVSISVSPSQASGNGFARFGFAASASALLAVQGGWLAWLALRAAQS